jgi:hypothetical protein
VDEEGWMMAHLGDAVGAASDNVLVTASTASETKEKKRIVLKGG